MKTSELVNPLPRAARSKRQGDRAPRSNTRRSSMRFALLAASAAVLATLLACELCLRFVGYSWLQWYRPDPLLGWTLRPGLAGWYAGEGRSFVQVNSAGWRDREHALAKPANLYRIAVLGDAYSEAMQLPMEESYWAQLPQRLESCGFRPGKRIEVLNFGTRDYGTAQSYLVLERTALRYQPDLVLLQFTNGNDVRDNSYALDPIKGRPYFKVDANGRLALDDSFASSQRFARRASPEREFLTALVDHSRALQLVRQVAIGLRDRAQSAGGAREPAEEARMLAASAPHGHLEEAWRVTEALISKIGEAAARNGASVALVAVPFPIEAHPDAAHREALKAKYGVDFAYPDRRVVAYAQRSGMHGIMLGPEMQALAAATGSYLYGYENLKLGSGHWNERGHRAAAEIIARSLCANPSW